MRRNLAISVIIMLAGALGWQVVQACGPVFAVAVFHFSRHPDFPRSRFLGGHLGILQPTWARSYLVISWRYLNGIGLDSGERQQAEDYYKDRNTGWWDKTGTDWVKEWTRVRDRVKGVKKPAETLVTQGKFSWSVASNSFFLNCAEDAFRNAANTLGDRIGRFGVQSVAVRDWVNAQNQVFANCDGTAKSIPSPAAPELPQLIRDDRRYQIAAALFYSNSLEQALNAFKTISRDSSSAWWLISRYLVARTMLRMTEDPAQPPSAAGLFEEIDGILADPQLAPIHSMTLNLLSRNGLRTTDRDYFHHLDNLVSSKHQGNGFREALWNYTTQYDHLIGAGDPNTLFPDPDAPKADPKLFESDEMSAWIFHFQSRDSSSGTYAIERWQQTHSLPWLMVALRHATYELADRHGLLNAAREVTASSPAYETVAWHYYRLLLDGKDKSSVRDGVDAILNSGKLTPSSRNLFRSLRMTAASNLLDFVRFALHHPLLITFDSDNAEVGSDEIGDGWYKALLNTYDGRLYRFGQGAAEIINNKFSLRLIREAASSPTLPAHLRRELLLVQLTRALLLGRDLKDSAGKLGQIDPSLATRVQAIVAAESESARRFATVHLILWQPEANPFVNPGIYRQTANGKIDNYRDNWWCPVTSSDQTSSRGVPNFAYWREVKPHPLFPTQTPSFLTAKDLEEAAEEREALIKSGKAMDFLGSIVLAWARSHPNDPRVPEALHRQIRGTRVTCDGERDTAINRQAFRLLKTRYRNSVWARKTTVM